ncbi:MAG: hypothetical protein U0354_21145 [Candidatus Sericytochromatia bacterium]
MPIKQWYSKKDILEIYPISIATYKNRIRSIDPTLTKFIKSASGSPTRLIHHSILDELFRKRRGLSKKEYKQTIKWVWNHHWNYIGNIVPENSTIDDIKHKMNFLFKELQSLSSKKNDLTLFYSVEKNSKDNYYHSHFLIDCKKTILNLKDIINKLEIICEPNTGKETRIHIKNYDLDYDKSGAIYSSKEKEYFFEILK